MILDASDFLTALPEIFLLGMACLVLLIDLFLTEHSRAVTYLLSQVALVGAAREPTSNVARVSFSGAGNYAGRVLIPAFK